MKNSFLVICLLCATANSQTRNRKSMVRIPAATFPMGTETGRVSQIAAAFNISKHPDLIQAETPQHTVMISSFYLDKFEVTNSQFQKFIRANPQWSRRVSTGSGLLLSLWERLGEGAQHSDRIMKNETSMLGPLALAQGPDVVQTGNYLKDWNGNNFPKGKANHPVVNVSWYAAVAFCQSFGKRLPTEAEWEYAARGGLLNKTFPWGDEPADKTRANFSGSGIGATTPVGSYPANGYSLFDMAGNVWEFLADEWGPYSDQPQTNPVAGGSLFLDQSFFDVTARRVIRGGSFGGAPLNLRVTYRDSHPPDGAREFVGFRCAAS